MLARQCEGRVGVGVIGAGTYLIDGGVRRFGLTSRMRPFSRCLACNGPLASAEVESPPRDRARSWSLRGRTEQIGHKASIGCNRALMRGNLYLAPGSRCRRVTGSRSR